MAENSAIEWTDHTFNPWEGCQKVGPGCDHCYAETRNARFAAPKGQPRIALNWGPGAPRRRTSASNWAKPRRWQADAARFHAQHGRRQRVFCASLADAFDNAVPESWRVDLFQLIRETPDLDWLLLTKRISNAQAMAEAAGEWPANVWIGATIVNQAEADRDIPKLLAIDGPRVRFLSMEPLLGPVDLTSIKAPRYDDEPADSLDIDWRFDALTTGDYYWFEGEHGQPGDCSDGPYRNNRIDWVIAGGESGAEARPSHPDWYRALRDQCAGANLHGDDAPVPFLFKQWGEWREWDDGSGNPEAEEVENGTEYADMVYASAINPAFISQDGRVFTRPDLPEELPCRLVERVGKKAAGRLLDGVAHDGVPACRSPGWTEAGHRWLDAGAPLNPDTMNTGGQA